MLRQIIILLFILLPSIPVLAQNPGNIQGYIFREDGSPSAHASVRIEENNKGTKTNTDGRFEFSGLAQGEYTLVISAIGLETQKHKIKVVSNETTAIKIKCSDNTTELQTVTVTAEKQQNNLQNLPLAISAITAKKINEYRIWSVKDITALVPNLFVSNIGDERPYITIRGVGANSTTMGVAMFVDDIPQTSLQNAYSVINDVDRIEVLRGPQGTLYGRNAIGGVINIYSKTPANHWNGFAEISSGNYGMQRYSMAINGPLIKDKLFLKLSGFYHDREGYITNLFDNSTFDHYTGYGTSATLLYKPSATWDFNLNLNTYQNKNRGAYPYAANTAIAFSNPYTTNQNLNTWVNQSSVQPSLKIGYTGRNIAVKSISSFQKSRFVSTGLMDGDFSPYDFTSFTYLELPDYNYQNSFTQEIRVNSLPGSPSKWKWTGGALYVSEKSPALYDYGIGKDAVSADPYAPYRIILTSKSNFNIWSVFGQTTYRITDLLEVTAGLRYDDESKEFTNSQLFKKDGFPDRVLLKDSTRKAGYNAFSPKLNIGWQLKDNIKTYLSYSRGFRAGGFNEQTTNPNYISYGSEKSNNYEFGVKTTALNNQLRINAALFYIHWFDMQTTGFLPGSGNQQATMNTGEAKNYGAEIEAAYIPVKGLQLEYNVGYNHARYEKLPLPEGTTMKDFNGNKVFLTPQYTSVLAAQYQAAFTKTNKVRYQLRAEWNSIGEIYFDLKNAIRQSPYSLVNFKAGLSFSKFELTAWIRNTFKEKYLAFGYAQNGTFVMLGTPQTFGISGRVNF